jgi:hypothetical protein
MKKISVIAATLVGAAMLCAAPISLHQSQDKGLTLSLDKARAVIGRPLTPGSIAGVHRRYERRAYRGGYYGAGYGYYGYRRPYGYYGYRHHPYAAAQAGAATGQLTCKDAAKLQFPDEKKMRKAFKKECKQAYKASRATPASS